MTYFKSKILIYLTYKAQIAWLLAKKVIILAKYLDNINIFSKKLVAKLLKYLNNNKYIIDLKLAKQSFYRLISNLGLIEFKTFKTYININQVNDFICFFKFLVKILLLFI